MLGFGVHVAAQVHSEEWQEFVLINSAVVLEFQLLVFTAVPQLLMGRRLLYTFFPVLTWRH